MQFQEFQGKRIFITGAASGIGLAQVQAFLKNGAVVFGLDLQASPVKEDRYCHFIGSVSDKAFVEQIIKEIGQVDILCNTAGILDGYAKSLETDEALWDRIMNTNIKGTYIVTNAVLLQMIARKAGVIVNMASIAGLVAGGGGAAYTASKHAIIGYTKQLSYDYCADGIRANAIAPGAIETPMNAADFAGDGEMAKWVAQETPAGRWAQPQEVASVTLFLASEASSYMHGTVLPVDGGWVNK